MTIKDAIDTVTFELGELPACTDEACDALDYIEDHYENIEEVVRCKGCQYAWPEGDGYCCTNAEGMDVNAHLSGEEYCSCGKPRQSEPS